MINHDPYMYKNVNEIGYSCLNYAFVRQVSAASCTKLRTHLNYYIFLEAI